MSEDKQNKNIRLKTNLQAIIFLNKIKKCFVKIPLFFFCIIVGFILSLGMLLLRFYIRFLKDIGYLNYEKDNLNIFILFCILCIISFTISNFAENKVNLLFKYRLDKVITSGSNWIYVILSYFISAIFFYYILPVIHNCPVSLKIVPLWLFLYFCFCFLTLLGTYFIIPFIKLVAFSDIIFTITPYKLINIFMSRIIIKKKNCSHKIFKNKFYSKKIIFFKENSSPIFLKGFKNLDKINNIFIIQEK